MSVVDWLRDLFRPREPRGLPPSPADAMLEELMRERRELAEARQTVGGWSGDAIADGLSRCLGVPVVFEPDHRDVAEVRCASRAR